jgi:hypothetical protein
VSCLYNKVLFVVFRSSEDLKERDLASFQRNDDVKEAALASVSA